MNLVALTAVVFGASLAGAALVRRHADRLGLLDHPNERKLHIRTTARGGGVGIVIAACGGWVAYLWGAGQAGAFLSIVACQLLIAALGLADDLVSLSSGFRLLVQTAVGVFLAFQGLDSGTAAGASWAAALVPVVTVLWVVALTNAYNFMDGMDAIAGAQGIVAGAGWVLLALAANEPALGVLGLVLAAACAGFLVLNWPPATVFMGDVGSGFLGFSFAALAIHGGRQDPMLAVGGALVVWPFLFDTAVTLLRRLVSGENVFRAHRSHLYQRLALAGMSTRWVTVLYGALSGTGVLAALALLERWPRAAAATLVSITLLASMLWAYVDFRERRHKGSAVVGG